MARRSRRRFGVVCPRCGMAAARIIGRSGDLLILYLTWKTAATSVAHPAASRLGQRFHSTRHFTRSAKRRRPKGPAFVRKAERVPGAF